MPLKLIAAQLLEFNAIDINAELTNSPVESNISISRGDDNLFPVTTLANLTSSSVLFPIAETTITNNSPVFFFFIMD